MNKRLPFIFSSIIAIVIILSYTQVDLNLTLLSWPPYLRVQNSLTQLGYFNRGLNAFLWTIILSLLVLLYTVAIRESLKSTSSSDNIKKYLFIASIGGLLSYSVFSHDIFNYMFDARIFTKYNLNPYEYKALDFPQDEWTRFMHWTHRTYPYGPAWLVLSVIPSFLGLEKILLTLGLFKLLFVVSYLLSTIYIGKILSLYAKDPRLIQTGRIMFALHPLVLIDGLVSPHLDITMAALFVVGLYYFLNGKHLPSGASVLVSIGIKYITALFVPILLLKSKLKNDVFYSALVVSAALIVLAQSISRGAVQPWYFITLISLIPLLLPFWKLRYILVTLFFSIVPLWIYLYFLLTGEWNGVLWFI